MWQPACHSCPASLSSDGSQWLLLPHKEELTALMAQGGKEVGLTGHVFLFFIVLLQLGGSRFKVNAREFVT